MQPNIVDHLATFIVIAEASSFSQGARQMKCSVSSMSYSLSKLEDHCGFPLLKRGSGPTELTPKGRALFREAQAVVESARVFAAHAGSIKRGEESRIRMAVDIMFPYSPLLEVLSGFAARHAHVTLQLFSTSLNRLWEQLQSGAVDIGIAPLRDVPSDVEGRPFTSIDLIPVATKDHILATRKERLSLSELRRHRQLYYVGSPHLDVEKRGRIFSTDVWTSNDIEMLRIMIKRGIGWGFGTEHFF
jgi:DNA-binding transcriptional LysR family regulator